MDWLSFLMGIILGCALGIGFVGFIVYNQIMEASIEIDTIIPDCFIHLFYHARGLSFGQDWNNGTAANNHRKKLIEEVKKCEHFMISQKPLND